MAHCIAQGTGQILSDSFHHPTPGDQVVKIDFVPRFRSAPVVVISPFAGTGGYSHEDVIVEISAGFFRVRTKNGDPKFRINWFAMGEYQS